MHIDYVARHFRLDDEIRAYADKKLGKAPGVSAKDLKDEEKTQWHNENTVGVNVLSRNADGSPKDAVLSVADKIIDQAPGRAAGAACPAALATGWPAKAASRRDSSTA